MNFRSATANQQKNEDDLESFFGTGSRPSSATRPKPSSSDPFFDSQFPKKQSESVRTSNGSTVSMRNVVNLTVSRVIALYYLRGMQANTKFCFQRALTRNLGSASLGSLFVPSIEALRIVARELNLLEGEDEFMFSCAHCCLNVMQSVFKFGNSWAYVQIAAYGKSFTKASIDTWEVFQRHSQEMEVLVDSDITSALCFLSGVCSGALCVIMVAAWTAKVHQGYIATISLLAFFVGYLMGVSAVKAFYELLSQSTMSELHHEAKKPVAPAELCPILKTLYKILITRELSSQGILQALRDETMNDPRELIKMGQTHVFYIPSLLGDHQ